MCNIETAEKIYRRLEDRQSREVFNVKFNYIINKDEMKLFNWFLKKNKELCCPELDIYDSNRTIEKGYIIFGAGQEGYKSKKILEATNRKIIAWCDNNQLLWKSKIEDIEVISPGELVNNFRNVTVIISVKEWVLQIYQQLIKMGFTRENILIPKNGFLMGVSGKQYFDMFEPDSCECGGGGIC